MSGFSPKTMAVSISLRSCKSRRLRVPATSVIRTPGFLGTGVSVCEVQEGCEFAIKLHSKLSILRHQPLEDLDPLDLKAKAILHFQNPMKGSASKEGKGRALCEFDFEREVYDSLLAQEYIVTPQVPVGSFRIDMVVEGGGDRRLAVELDGEKWHGPEKWWADHRRQLALERMGWTFWRCWGSDWRLNRSACLEDLTSVLEAMGIRPGNGATTGSHQFTEHRVLEMFPHPRRLKSKCQLNYLPSRAMQWR